MARDAEFLLVAVALSFLLPIASATDLTVPIDSVVQRYLGSELELAVIPQPQQAVLTDRLLVTSGLEIKAEKGGPRNFILSDANAWLAGLAIPISDEAPRKSPCPLLLGELGDGSLADKLLVSLKLRPDDVQQKRMGKQGYVLLVGESREYPRGVVAIVGGGASGTYLGLQSLK